MKLQILATSAILAAATVLSPLALSSTMTFAACDPTTSAVQYLAANQKSDGSLDMASAGGFGNPVATMNMVISIAASGYDPNTITRGGKSGYDYLAANSAAATNTVGRAATLVLALQAGGVPPLHYDLNNFGGVHPFAVVQDGYHSSGPSAGAFDDGSSFTQALAILAYRADGLVPPAASVSWLQNLRNTGKTAGGYTGEPATDTGWSYANKADTAQADTNTTAEALMALSAVNDHTQEGAALAYLHDQQNPDGGFPIEKPSVFGTASDADSDALVLEALQAVGQSLATWTLAGNTPLSSLLAMQDSKTGGFSGRTPDTFTSSQAPEGLAERPLPVNAPAISRTLPADGCPAIVSTSSGVSAARAPAPSLPRAGTRAPSPAASAALVAALVPLGGILAALALRRRPETP